MNDKNLDELWRQTVHNKSFQLLGGIQDLYAAFVAMAPETWAVYDKFCIFERQISIVNSELRRLVDYASKLPDPDKWGEK